jgi:exosortase
MNIRTRTGLFFAIVLGSILLNMDFFKRIVIVSDDFSSLVIVTPFLSMALILRMKAQVFADVRSSTSWGMPVAGIGVLLYVLLSLRSAALSASDALSAKMLALVLLWIGAFLLLYGKESGRKALFPLLMLLFMVPIPEALLAKTIHVLQQGSGEGVAILFTLTGTPFHREGLAFMLPRTTIEIAPQCSSIRSSLALLIGCLLAGHLMLRTVSRKFILILVAIPMAMLKNAIRIVTLSLLAIHVDMGYLVGGDLHRRGGIVFFALTLLLLYPVLWALRKSEKAATN